MRTVKGILLLSILVLVVAAVSVPVQAAGPMDCP